MVLAIWATFNPPGGKKLDRLFAASVPKMANRVEIDNQILDDPDPGIDVFTST
jgi:hypothetical protein